MTVTTEERGRQNIYAIEPPIIVMSPSEYEATYGWTQTAQSGGMVAWQCWV